MDNLKPVGRSKAWNETETAFAKDVLEFVHNETFGKTAWFFKDEKGGWSALIPITEWALHPIVADSEEALARRYWEFYYHRVEKRAERLSTVWHFIFSHSKWKEAKAQLKRWNDWREQHFPK